MPYRYTPISDRTGRPPLGGAKRDPPEGGSIPGLLGVRARTPGTRGCTFLRVFNNSPSRDRSWCTVLTGGVKKPLFFRISGGLKCPPRGGRKVPPWGPLFPPPKKGPKRPPKRVQKDPQNDPLFDPHEAIWATLRWLSLPSRSKERGIQRIFTSVAIRQRRSDTTCRRRCNTIDAHRR